MAIEAETQAPNYIELTTGIVSAFVAANKVGASDLTALISSVDRALRSAVGGAVEPVKVHLIPAVPIKKSVTPDYIISLEDGRKFKSLKRHLRTNFDLSPDEYRAKWGLPTDYPMVAPNYAKARSELAKSLGLGKMAGRGSKVTRRSGAAVDATPIKRAAGKKS